MNAPWFRESAWFDPVEGACVFIQHRYGVVIPEHVRHQAMKMASSTFQGSGMRAATAMGADYLDFYTKRELGLFVDGAGI